MKIVTWAALALIAMAGLAAPRTALAQTGAPVAGSQCPDNFMAFKDETAPLACTCPAEATQSGSVWGTDVYTGDSSICRAALHAGRVRRGGGAVTVVGEAGRRAYPGTTRNGLSSTNFGPYEWSFHFEGDAPTTAAATTAPASQAVAAAPQQCPDDYSVFKDETTPLSCTCPAASVATGSVWGTDVYTADSAVCRAALHAGKVGRNGGLITVVGEPGRRAYPGTTRGGVSSSNYGPYEWSFHVEGTAPTAPVTVSTTPAAPQQCPDNYSVFKDETTPLACTCPAEATQSGSVWGTDIYTADSAVCRAALHAGKVGRNGGLITVVGEEGRRMYPGTTRNGISSSNYGPYEWSFHVESSGAPAPAAARASAGPMQCPDNAAVYKDDPTPVTCICPSEATQGGSVWGSDVYTADSAVCRAAVHAGMLTRLGGTVTFVPDAGQRAYPGTTKNGISSSNFGPYEASFRFTGTPVTTAPRVPVQASIGNSLRSSGKVNLYVQFRTGAADLDMASAPVLMELLAVMRADTGLRLKLIGHTDTAGTRAINGPLSVRRAAAVKDWLVGQGVDASRLSADGRGQDEPLAPNTTDEGRALNRRVQAALAP